MEEKDQIATWYSNARELVRQNNPKAARAYVLAILNCAVKTYSNASTILLKARTAAFLDQWIAVSRDLYDKGITDYVLQCFALPVKNGQPAPKARASGAPRQKNAAPRVDTAPGPTPAPSGGEIDISGLIDETAKSQGWCAEVFERNKPAVVEIATSGAGIGATGTGFIISKNGYLLTNDHVVFCEETQSYYPKAQMTFAGGKRRCAISILFSDKKSDVALCRFDPGEVGTFGVIERIPDYAKVLQGADCLVIGNAFGMGLAPFTGTIRYTKNDSGNLVYTALSNPGDSGGPVLNRQGKCIGINKSKTVSVHNVMADGYANATPMDRINELLKKWCDSNEIEL